MIQILIYFKKYIFIYYLFRLHWVLVAALGIFVAACLVAACGIFSCGMQAS